MKKLLLKWELWGILAISIVGAILHFVFEWSGEWNPIGTIAAVNESVWEHFKIAFWPALFYGIAEYAFLKRSTNNFGIAKAAGIYAIPVTIALIFYSYTATTGKEILIVDILSFIVAIAVGQIISYRILTLPQLPAWLNKFGLALLIALAIAFVVFTFFPPHLPIFRDSVTGAYGIP